MHRFLRSVGFAALKKRRDEDWLLRKIEKEFSASTSFKGADGEEQVALDLFLDKGMGIVLRGSWRKDGSFRPEFYYPYLTGGKASTMVPCQVERHSAHSEFSGFLEDMKLGFMLIFFVQNGIQYEKACGQAEVAVQSGGVNLSALSVNGKVLIPIHKDADQLEVARTLAAAKEALLEAAKQGDEDAMETLTIGEYQEAAIVAERLEEEDVYSIVDTTFMPCGVESDHYSVLGNIKAVRSVKNPWTDEDVYVMSLECNDMEFDVAINALDLEGEPEPGRRFKGDIWLQGKLEIPRQAPGASSGG